MAEWVRTITCVFLAVLWLPVSVSFAETAGPGGESTGTEAQPKQDTTKSARGSTQKSMKSSTAEDVQTRGLFSKKKKKKKPVGGAAGHTESPGQSKEDR